MTKKFLSAFLFVVFFSTCVWGLGFSGHNNFQNQYLWGLTTETSRNIHSTIIDTVPWRPSGGGYQHRDLWGHSYEWFYNGKIPKAEAMNDIKHFLEKQNPKISPSVLQNKAEIIFKEATLISGQERIANALIEYSPSLTKKEAMLMAEQSFAAHVVADSTTSEGAKMSKEFVDRMKNLLSSPSSETVTAYNKLSVQAAINEQGKNFSPENFASQSTNFSRLKAEYYSQKGFQIFNPAARNDIGIISKGQRYIFATDTGELNGVFNRYENISDIKIILPDDQYEKFLRSSNKNFTAMKNSNKIFSESSITGINESLETQKNKFAAETKKIQQNIVKSQETKNANLQKALRNDKSKFKTAAPYVMFGAITSIAENWEILNDAYNNKAEWSKALTRTGIDFAGYTVTPVVIDGIFTSTGKQFALMTSLKNAGMGYTLGYFVWNGGKEFISYQIGDISLDDFQNRIKKQAARGIEAIPVNVLAYIVSTSGYTILVPVVIVGGSFAIQRVHAWYEEKRWLNAVYVEDLEKILGEDLMNIFTLINPETNFNIAEPETNFNIAQPFSRKNLITY